MRMSRRMGLWGASKKLFSVIVSGGGSYGGWVVYNGNKYYNETISALSGETITVTGNSRKSITIMLNENNVANGYGATYTMSVTADTAISISGNKDVTIKITTA